MPAFAQEYHDRLAKVLHYIGEHLEDDLTVENLSGVAAFSKFHFHRQFSALFSMNVHRYIQLARLKRAADRLAFRHGSSVLEIALESGYESSEAFARVFKLRLSQTPTEFRTAPEWPSWHTTIHPLNDIRRTHMKAKLEASQVQVIDFPETRVAAMEHLGDPALIGNTIRRFIEWRKSVGLHPRHSATFNVFYSDSSETAPEEFRMDLCAATAQEIPANNYGVVAGTIPGGRCAVLRHTGSDEGLGQAISYLYAHWLPQSGEELRDFPPYVQRISFFPDVPEYQAVADIFLSLR